MTAIDKLRKIQQDIQTGVAASLPKPARVYFSEIVNLTKDRQNEALEQIPDDKREQVRFYLEDHENKLNGLVSMVMTGNTRDERNKLLDRVPPEIRDTVRQRVIASYKPRRNSKTEQD